MVKSEGVVGELVIQSIYLTKMRGGVREYKWRGERDEEGGLENMANKWRGERDEEGG